MNCSGCGKEITDLNQEFCDNCGAKVSKESPQQQSADGGQTTPPPVQQPVAAAEKLNNTKQIVWSIIAMVLCNCPGFIFGLIGLILALTAKNQPTPEERQKKLKTSMTLSIVGIVLGALVVIIYGILMAVGIASGL